MTTIGIIGAGDIAGAAAHALARGDLIVGINQQHT